MAEIKRIQLRGISRSPSDRMTDDGGVAESLNMHLDNTENAPSFAAEDVTTSLGLPANLKADRVFIHKTPNYKNFIVALDDKVVAYTPDIIDDNDPITVLELTGGERVEDVTSIGNTLVLSTSNNLYYVLYYNKEFKFLGNKVPFPEIVFEPVYEGITKVESYFDVMQNIGFGSQYDLELLKTQWNSVNNKKEHTFAAVKEQTTAFWEKYDTAYNLNKQNNDTFCSPLFVRYAAQSLDGDCASSMPLLMNPSNVNFIAEARYTEGMKEGQYEESEPFSSSALTYHAPTFKLHCKILNGEEMMNWKDFYPSINLYLTKPVKDFINRNSSLMLDVYDETVDHGAGEYDYNVKATIQMTVLGKDALLATSQNSYLVKKIYLTNEDGTQTEDFKDLMDGFTFGPSLLRGSIDPEKVEGDEGESEEKPEVMLEVQERLLNDDMKHYVQTSKKLDVYNHRVILTQPTQLIDYEYSRLNSIDVKDGSQTPTTYDITYVLRGYKEDKVVKKTFSSSDIESIYPFQIFPDSRAYKMIVKVTRSGKSSYGEFNMYPHPYLDCAYYCGDLSKHLYELCTASSAKDYSVQRIDDLDNKLLISSMDNPSIFLNDGKFTFQSTVIGVAVATRSLSQGQFGQYPLYVFTEDGIWAMETAADGSFVTNKPLSRDVCVNPASITSIDNAVVFVSEQGVMLLQGSQTVNISPYMNGRHYTIENTAKTIIERQDFFCDLLPVLTDKTHFLAFVKEASVAYDYAGKRLVFIKPDEKYQYVYKLDTQTWHKTAYEADLIAPINSYPRCLIQGVANGKTVVYDLSTVLDAEESKIPMRGVIATRPFDLGEPDVLKTITDVRVRGQFPKGAVKFILLGSNDGVNFSTISTLRGKSWKLFRMIILADLDPTDRISWVDVQYETRFTNKLR